MARKRMVPAKHGTKTRRSRRTASKKKTKASAARTRRARSSQGGREVWVFGASGRADKVAERLSTLRATVRRRDSYDPTIPLGLETAAVVLADPTLDASLEALVRSHNRTLLALIPIFVVVGDESADRMVRRLYAAGATAVFSWPREALSFPRLVAESLGMAIARGVAREPDTALARAARARVRLVGDVPENIRLTAHDGTIHVEGEVDRLWKRDLVEEVVSHVPGVRGAVVDRLRVSPTGLSDQKIAKSVRSLIDATASIGGSTLAVSVEGGRVQLAGSISSRGELHRLTELVRHVNGVRDVENFVTVAPAQRESDSRVSNKLRRAIDALASDQNVSLAVFGGIAVVRGTVDTLATKRQILRVLERHDAVERVVDKITIR